MFSKKHDIDMNSGSLFKSIFIFAIPIMAMNILQLLFNAADMIVVGRFAGVDPLAAVGATGALINLIINLFMGLSVGTSVVIAQDYGSGNTEEVRRSVHTSMTLSIILGIVVMIIGLSICKPLLIIMGTPEDILDLADLYMKIYFLGVPASMVYNFGAAILRAVGDSRSPMYFLIISGIVNVIFNVIFVVGFNMSVEGVAWPTVISQYLSVYLIIRCLIKYPGPIRFYPKELGLDQKKLFTILKIGVPAGLQGLLFSISNVLIQSAVNSFGTITVAASTASGNVESFVATTMNAYYNAAITFTGQSMGAKQYKRIDSIAKVCTVLIFSTWFILGGITVIFGRPLLSIYNSTPEVLDLGMLRMYVMMGAYFSCGMMNVFPGLTRGMGFSILPMLSTLIGACLLRIVWIYTIFAWFPTIVVLFACYPVTWSIAGIGQIASFFYARKRVNEQAVKEEYSEDADYYEATTL